jgi:hypothetical protein
LTKLPFSTAASPGSELSISGKRAHFRTAFSVAVALLAIAVVAGCGRPADNSASSGTTSGTATVNTTTTSPVGAWEKILSSAVGKPKGEYSTYQWAKEPGFGVVEFQFVADENLTENLTSRGAKLDVVKLLEQVKDSGRPFSAVSIAVCYPYVDNFGKVTIQKIAELTYPKATVDKIQFKTIDAGTIYTIASPSNVKVEWR